MITNSHNQLPAINGLVLSGGQSTRMGKDKGEIHYHNKTQRRYLYELLSAYCQSVFISCNAQQAKYITDLPVIADMYINTGPLGGLLSAFQHDAGNAWLVVACDLPFISDETIAYLIQHRNALKKATAYYNNEAAFPEPMLAIWEPGIYPVLQQFKAKGNYSLRKALIDADIEMLHPQNLVALKNINTQEEFEEALCMLQKKG